ncbi:MAG TPA: hypothetical protein VFV86_09505 [Nitrososphaeraceae archaeon]|nr:hypothetical protein [Nitrososphaeraceae archaeon]
MANFIISIEKFGQTITEIKNWSDGQKMRTLSSNYLSHLLRLIWWFKFSNYVIYSAVFTAFSSFGIDLISGNVINKSTQSVA